MVLVQPSRLIMPRFIIAGAIAGTKNFPSELRIPISNAASETINKNGIMNRAMVMVEIEFARDLLEPFRNQGDELGR